MQSKALTKQQADQLSTEQIIDMRLRKTKRTFLAQINL